MPDTQTTSANQALASGGYLPKLSPDFVARALAMATPGNPARAQQAFSFVTTDSRQVRPGCLFVALKGDNFDGHDFVDAAISQGARGVICKRGTLIKDAKDVCIFPTDNTLGAFRKLASLWRREFSIPFVVVAGSVGKTTTKELLAAICHGKWENVLKTAGSQNGFVGIPMTLLDLRPEHSVAIIEVGIDAPNTMVEHIDLVHPTHSLLTAIAEEHLEQLKDIPTVAREEGEALKGTAQLGGTVLIQMDDPWIRPHLHTLRVGLKVPFGIEPREELQIQGTLKNDGSEETLQVQAHGLNVTLPLPLPGVHNARNLMAAVSAAHVLGLTPEEIERGLATFKGAAGRSEVRLIHGSKIICDYYNANPASMRAGIALLGPRAQQPRFACLGDMLELGPDELQFHRALAEPIMEAGIESVLLFGERMQALQEELQSKGYTGKVAHFETHAALANALTYQIKKGDPILIKGSRSMHMEEVWKILEPYAKTQWQ